MGNPIVCRIASTWDGTPLPAGEAATVEIDFGGEGARVRVRAPFYDDPAPDGPPGPTPELWNHEAVEVFLLGSNGYLEAEFNPHGHYLVLFLTAPRRIARSLIPIDFASRIDGDRWEGTAHLPRALLPRDPDRFNAYHVHGGGAARRYLAAFPVPGKRPDFHRLECFGPLSAETPAS
jgi:hypothetical protein